MSGGAVNRDGSARLERSLGVLTFSLERMFNSAESDRRSISYAKDLRISLANAVALARSVARRSAHVVEAAWVPGREGADQHGRTLELYSSGANGIARGEL